MRSWRRKISIRKILWIFQVCFRGANRLDFIIFIFKLFIISKNKKHKLAIFIDGEFWHGYKWREKKSRLKANRAYWIPKIEKTILRDRKISEALERLTVPEIKNSRLGIGYEEKVKEFYMINVENLIPFKNQARIYFDDKEIENLSESIKRHGIRQPLTIIPYEDNKGIFEVISGERRLKAAKIVGLDKVPCIIIHDRNIAQEIAIVENIHRQDLHPIELGLAF